MPLVRAEFKRKHRQLRSVLKHDISQVLYLPFDYDDGNYARDRSGHNNHGTNYGAVHATGKVGDALKFDGVDDEVVIPYALSLDLATYSVLFWANISDLTSPRAVVGNRDVDCTFDVKFLSGGLHGDIGDGTKWLTTAADYPFTPVLNRWYHVAYVVTSGGDCKIYLDGEYKTTITFTGTPKFVKSPGHVRVGQTGLNVEWFSGLIDEVRIYNRALSQAEIQRVMNMRGL